VSCCPQATTPLTDRHRVKLHYLGGRPVQIRGPVTGTPYRFSGLARLQLVDPRDAVSIVRDPLFRFAGVVEAPDPLTIEGRGHA
jgi:hypothetical protein